jgi:hypothetical protein
MSLTLARRRARAKRAERLRIYYETPKSEHIADGGGVTAICGVVVS